MTNPQQELELYSIKDLKIGKFLPPFFASNREEATRLMREQVNYKSSLISSFPSDYELYFLGTFTDFTGEICNDNPEIVCNLQALKQDDTVKYDELLTQTKNLQAQVDASVMRFNNAMKDFQNSFDLFLKDCQKKFDQKFDDVSDSDVLKKNDTKNSLIQKLFQKNY